MVDIEIDRDFSLVPRLMVISRGLFPTTPSDLRTLSDIIHHQSSLDFLEFTKIRRIFMNRSMVTLKNHRTCRLHRLYVKDH